MNRTKQCLIMILVFLLGLITIMFVVFPALKVERFNDDGKIKTMDMPPKIDQTKIPYYDDNTYTIMSGPNFTAPEFQGIDKPPFAVVPQNSYLLDDGAGGNMGLMTAPCSKSCCSDQWPLPFKLKYEPYICGNKDKYVPNNYMCNNAWQDSGCLCLTKDQSNFLENRGGNI